MSKDVITRIGMARQKMLQLNDVWKDRGNPTILKVKLLKSLIWPVMLYGCEAWTLKRAEEKKLEAAEMWLYRRLLRVKWTDKRTNESILGELSNSKQVLQDINKKRLKYFGHVMRNKTTLLMSTVLQGKTEAKRRKGRPTTSYTENIKRICKLSHQEASHRSQNRTTWRRTVLALNGGAIIDNDDADR